MELLIGIVATVLIVTAVAYIGSRFNTARTMRLEGDGRFAMHVVGESNYQRALSSLVGGRRLDGVEHKCDAVLILEDDNRYDALAVRVEIESRLVGYLSRNDARRYRAALSKIGKPRIDGVVRAIIRGGWDRGGGDIGQFGVVLDL